MLQVLSRKLYLPLMKAGRWESSLEMAGNETVFVAVHAACWPLIWVACNSNTAQYSCTLHRQHDLPKIVAVDLQPMAPIEGVIQLQAGSIACYPSGSDKHARDFCRTKVRRGPCSSQSYHSSVQGDITSSKTAAAVVAHFDGHHADLVVSDGAPDGRETGQLQQNLGTKQRPGYVELL